MNLGDDICHIYPSSIDNTNFKYIKVDQLYVSSILITSYPRFTSFLQIIESIPKKYLYDMSIFIRKQDNMKVLKDLTYYISSSSGELKTSNKNQIDIDLVSKVKEDAIELRKQIQIHEQEIFFINIMITFYEKDKGILLERIKEFQSIIYSKSLTSNLANFRHLESYILSLPLSLYKEKLFSFGERTFTSNTLSYLFPFYTKTIFDKDGVIFGFTQDENKICNIDLFAMKYMNANMCVFGSSGSGKSYFIKLLVIRLFLQGVKQYIIDPEGEYENIAKYLKGNYVEFASKTPEYYINPFEIFEFEVKFYGSNLILEKVKVLRSFICYICKIDQQEEIEMIEKAIKEVYKKFHMIDVESVYIKNTNDKIYVDNILIPSNQFPVFEDLLKEILSKKLREKIKKCLIEEYPIFIKHTNFPKENKLFIFNTKSLKKKDDLFFVNQIIEYFLLIQKNNLKNKQSKLAPHKSNAIIYIDEIWKYIKKVDSNHGEIDLGKKIFELFKTIRKNDASIVAITQDISDFFHFEDGNYGKSIINNSSFKIFFKLDFSDSEFLEKYYILNKQDLIKVNRLEKGQNLISFKNITITLNIKANEYEKEILEGGVYENNNSIES